MARAGKSEPVYGKLLISQTELSSIVQDQGVQSQLNGKIREI
jgi:hypothetical protein